MPELTRGHVNAVTGAIRELIAEGNHADSPRMRGAAELGQWAVQAAGVAAPVVVAKAAAIAAGGAAVTVAAAPFIIGGTVLVGGVYLLNRIFGGKS